jgi:simple sugar transport system substrate-binding protein
MVTHGDSGQFWSTVKKGAEDGAKDEGVKLTYSSSNNDPQKQAQAISAAVSQKVDGLAVSAANPNGIKDALKQATAAGIPIITLNSGQTASKSLGALTHVGQDEDIAGRAVGARLKADGVKKVLCVIQEQNNIALNQRCAGVKAGFGGPVENVNVKGTSDVATSQTEMQTKLRADSSIDAVVTLESSIAQAAVQARDGAHSQARQATFDLSPDVLKSIQDGKIEFAVDQQPYLQGYVPIVLLKLYKTNLNVAGGGQPILTGPGIVDKTNAAKVAELAGEGTR